MRDEDDRGGSGIVEIRVHGVKDHPDYSALGKPDVVQVPEPETPGGARRRTNTVTAPAGFDHPVWLLNWSRTNRAITGLLWYMALPYTLLNVAGNTSPTPRSHQVSDDGPSPEARADAWVTSVVAIASIFLTVTTLVWFIAITETVLAYFRPADPESASTAGLIFSACALATLITFTIGIRAAYGHFADRRRSQVAWAAVHLTVVAVSAIAIWLIAPARQPAEEGWSDFQFFVSWAPRNPTEQGSTCPTAADVLACYGEEIRSGFAYPYVDPLDLAIAAGLIISISLGAVLFLRGVVTSLRARRSDRQVSAPSAAGALLVVLAFGVLTVFGSLLRQAIDWVLSVVESFPLFSSVQFPQPQPYNFVLPFEISPFGLSLANAFPLLGGLGLVTLVIVVLLAGLGGGGDSPSSTYFHRLVASLHSRLALCIAIAAILWGGLLWAFYFLWSNLTYEYPPGEAPNPGVDDIPFSLQAAGTVTSILTAITTVVVFIVIAFGASGGRLHAIRTIFDLIADVVGFWPPRWHPLSGGSYRESVIAGLRALISHAGRERTVLVGHSQGSVLAFWSVATDDGTTVPSRLITCGSPLASLYRRYFPTLFSDRAFTYVASRIPWTNVWRDTDPIADDIAVPSSMSTSPIPDPRVPGSAREGHSNYWKDPSLLAAVTRQAAPD